jgi:MoaD family protein
MTIPVHYYSYFKELAGAPSTTVELPDGSKIDDLLKIVYARHPKLGGMHNATLIAVGVEYQGKSYVLKQGDEVSLFPPVQGG